MLKFDKLKGYGKVYFLNEDNNLTSLAKANSFIYKENTKEGFNEYYGVLVDPNASIEDMVGLDEEHLQEVNDVELRNMYKQYELNKKFILRFEDKDVPIFIPYEYIKMTPSSWYGSNRTKDVLAAEGKRRQEAIFNFYKTNLHQQHLHTLMFVRTTSVAWLYYYLHSFQELWQPGFEKFGYVDGLWETGGKVTIAIDSGTFRIHTSVHELGHSMSYYLTDRFFNEYYNIAINKSEKPPTEYGRTDIAEDYAESYGFYFSGEKSRVVLRKMAPTRFGFMQRLEQVGASAIITNIQNPTSALNKRFKKFDTIVYNIPRHKYVVKHPSEIEGETREDFIY